MYKNFRKKTFIPDSSEPFKISRSKIDMFTECPRCFYLDQRLGVSRPSIPAFTLNSAVDHLLKKEFDIHRAEGTAHPLMKAYKLEAIPFEHEKMEEWRHNFTGVRYIDGATNLLVFGAVDDIWFNLNTHELHVVDYKATAKDSEVKELENTRWHNQYRRQMEVYQWLLRKNGFKVSDIGYFVYVNGRRDREAFDAKLEFDVNLIAYKGDDNWVSEILPKIKKCLASADIPESGKDCEYCPYRESAGRAFREAIFNSREEKVVGRKTRKIKIGGKNEETEKENGLETGSLF